MFTQFSQGGRLKEAHPFCIEFYYMEHVFVIRAVRGGVVGIHYT